MSRIYLMKCADSVQSFDRVQYSVESVEEIVGQDSDSEESDIEIESIVI